MILRSLIISAKAPPPPQIRIHSQVLRVSGWTYLLEATIQPAPCGMGIHTLKERQWQRSALEAVRLHCCFGVLGLNPRPPASSAHALPLCCITSHTPPHFFSLHVVITCEAISFLVTLCWKYLPVFSLQIIEKIWDLADTSFTLNIGVYVSVILCSGSRGFPPTPNSCLCLSLSSLRNISSHSIYLSISKNPDSSLDWVTRDASCGLT